MDGKPEINMFLVSMRLAYTQHRVSGLPFIPRNFVISWHCLKFQHVHLESDRIVQIKESPLLLKTKNIRSPNENFLC